MQVSCANGTTVGEWDYNAWNVKLDDISDGSKCTLAFTGGMSKEEYQKYIEQGVATRRNTYRGKDLTEFFTQHPDDFYKQIKEGTFDDIYVGDYIKKGRDESGNEITWLIADIDNYMNTGSESNKLTSHHLTMIPAAPLMQASMNTENTTNGGYYGSRMVSGCDGKYNDYESIKNGNCTGSILDKVYTTYIQPNFAAEHVLTYANMLTTATDKTRINRFGISGSGIIYVGASSEVSWVNRQLDLMSEINVFGTTIWSSSGHDAGIDNRQYALFQLKPELINSDGKKTFYYWLKDVAGMAAFSLDIYGSVSGGHGSSLQVGVRPRFLIG